MIQKMSLNKNRTNLKLSTANIMCVATAFIWYLLAFKTLQELASNQSATVSETLLIFGVNAGAIALSGLLGSFIVDKFKKRRLFLYLWIVSGIALSILPLALNFANINELLIISLIFGLYFGLGMPATMGYHSSFTNIEGRAKIGGLTFLLIGVATAVVSFIPFDTVILPCLILAIVRLIGLGFFHFMPITQEPNKETSKVKYTEIIRNRSFIFYFIPWLMFTLINYTTVPTQANIAQIANNPELLDVLESIVIALVAVIGGFVADRWGRKRLTIIGFVMLGLGYAVLSLYPQAVFGSIIYAISDGVAWGIFYVLFVWTLWGDLAQNRNSDKFYFLGVLPFVSAYFIQLVFSPILEGIAQTTIFSFASVFLFLAVLPLIYAPETLPEKLMKDRDLKSYIENAKKKAQKESGNDKKKGKPSDIKNDEEPAKSDEGKEYDDAVKLAEKYY
jgi:MFS family permease